MERDFSNLKDGLSGIIRAKNEGRFIEGCIDSCIDALDELIICYNDCTDGTPEIVERKRQQYPEKIKVYPYNNNVLSHNLTREEFEYASKLPKDSPRLHCNQCNFALSKVSYKYAVKIDPDQVYFADEIKKWRDVCSKNTAIRWNVTFIMGWLFMMYISAYRRLSVRLGFPCLWMIPNWLVSDLKNCYVNYIKWRLQRESVAVSFSGVNLFYDGSWSIPFDRYNVHPPYNGEGDTLLFRVSDKTYFVRYNKDKLPYAVVESFVHPYKIVIAGDPVWFHLHANRDYCYYKVKQVKEEHPEWFVPVNDFLKMSYQDVLKKTSDKVPTLFQKILFALVHKMGMKTIKEHCGLLNQIRI